MDSVDTLWLIMASFLVLLMQPGFLMLEGGRVRSKNSINVAQKNATDLVIVWVSYLSLGYYLMYGHSAPDLFSMHESATAPSPLHFVFQFGFACTAATILSGAVSERISYRAYLVIVALMSCLFYPLVGKLVWGATYNPDASALLGDMGFVDFAGSSVVHGVGAWFALVALLMIGPRAGRFNQQGEPQLLPAHSAVMALFGVLLLMLGWIGFNGGMVSPGDPLLQSVIFNTMNAAAFGATAGMLAGVVLDKGVFSPTRLTAGLLGGLVACTAGVHLMSALDAMIVGALGGLVATIGAYVLLHRFKLDDPLDVVATHGGAGVLGTLAVAFVGSESALPAGSRLAQLTVQAFGVVIVALIAGSGCWITIVVLRRFMLVRVSDQAEKIGLNYAEHGESVVLSRLKDAMENQTPNESGLADTVLLDADDEHSELTLTLNKMVSKYDQANQRATLATRRFQQFAETASDWLWETDSELQITYVHNSTGVAEAGFIDQLLGTNLMDQLTMRPQVREQVCAAFRQCVSTPAFEAQLSLTSRGRELLPTVEVRGVPFHDTEGNYVGYRGTATDISARKSAENKALFLSLHDELTGLLNRRALSRDVKEARTKIYSDSNAIVIACIDLDGFKGVNDAYGHPIGDELLKQVAQRLKQFLRPEDIAYRTGGDEFVVLLNGLKNSTALTVANAIMQRLVDEVSRLYYVQTLDIKIGASVGLSCYPFHGNSVDDLLRKADLALYAAKRQGKGCVVDFQPDMDIDARLQLKIESDLHKAIARGEFYLNYQPQIDSASNQIVGFEALIRWAHPERGDIPPDDFIAAAEKLNLMDKIGAYVLDTACRFAASWPVPANGKAYRIAVNVSPQQFRDAAFAQTLGDTLARYSLAPERLEIEIVESLLGQDFGHVSSLLEQIRSMGVAVAVDNFGTGQTSLRNLCQFPISSIKIDRSYIKNMASDTKAAEITQTIVALGHRLGVNVLAEGVEQADQLAMLRNWNIDQIQGFLIAKPLSTSDMVESMLTGEFAITPRKRA